MNTIDCSRCPCCGSSEYIPKTICFEDKITMKAHICSRCGIVYVDFSNRQKDLKMVH